MRHLIIASTSTVHGHSYLGYLLEDIKLLFKGKSSIVFIPYARPSGISYEDYTAKVKAVFSQIHIDVKGIHEFKYPLKAIQEAEGLFTGGGNTFVLVNALYKNKLVTALREAVNSGTPYLGTSAGSNICGLTMSTTNDMPIIYPESFKTLGLVPFNINPHYLDPDPKSTHKGETRETRINEFHQFNTQPVIGLREGSWLDVKGEKITLKGNLDARIFKHNLRPFETAPESDLSNLK